eukprot:9263852-Prorocentrum_lima.AAC.1
MGRGGSTSTSSTPIPASVGGRARAVGAVVATGGGASGPGWEASPTLVPRNPYGTIPYRLVCRRAPE